MLKKMRVKKGKRKNAVEKMENKKYRNVVWQKVPY